MLQPGNLQLCQQGALGAMTDHIFTALSSSQLQNTTLPVCELPSVQELEPGDGLGASLCVHGCSTLTKPETCPSWGPT